MSASKSTHAPSPVAKADPARTTTLRVLVAEDHAVNRMLAKKLLEKLGCAVDVACDGADAVLMASRGDYDLIFMDCSMPNMDGYAATAELRRCHSNGPHLPIIALTANAMAEDRAACLAAGMDDYVSKPIDIETLRAVLRRWTPEQRVSRNLLPRRSSNV